MKHLKLFESMNQIEVEKICKKYGIENWSINKDGLVDVDGDVSFLSFLITRQHAAEFPLQFGSVTGDFLCFSNKLTTLEGAPQAVGGGFYCHINKLVTLEGAPQEVNGDFLCTNNNLTTLEGGPKEVGRDFLCSHNNLTTLEGSPREVGGNFFCNDNFLTTLKGAPEYVGVEVIFLPNKKLPTEFLNFLQLNSNRDDLQTYIFKWQKDYAIWRKDGSFNKANFIRMMEDAQDELQNLKFPK